MSHKPKIDHTFTKEIICPWCGHEQSDPWEFRDEGCVIDCGSCDQKFNMIRHIIITHSTTKV